MDSRVKRIEGFCQGAALCSSDKGGQTRLAAKRQREEADELGLHEIRVLGQTSSLLDSRPQQQGVRRRINRKNTSATNELVCREVRDF